MSPKSLSDSYTGMGLVGVVLNYLTSPKSLSGSYTTLVRQQHNTRPYKPPLKYSALLDMPVV